MKVQTSTLIGPALDWAVAIALGWIDVLITGYNDPDTPEEPFFRPAKIVDGIERCGSGCRWRPSVDWATGGPIIHREKIHWGIGVQVGDRKPSYIASIYQLHRKPLLGPTELIAAMRCFVASKLGDEVDVPEELLA